MGIVGLPNVGKSSLFNTLSESVQSLAENRPFATIDPAESRCAVPDDRYDLLCNLWNPASRYPAYVGIWDIAGLVKGASVGEGLGNAFLSHIAAVDGIYHVVRAFDAEEVRPSTMFVCIGSIASVTACLKFLLTRLNLLILIHLLFTCSYLHIVHGQILHIEDTVDPIRDLAIIQHELCVKDLASLDRAIANEERDVKKSQGMKISVTFRSAMDKVRALLTADKAARSGDYTGPEVEMINHKLEGLLTLKPMVYLINMSSRDYIRKKNKYLPGIHEWIKEHGGGVMIPFSVQYEEELHRLRDQPTELEKFVAENGGAKSALPKIINAGYEELNLIHYFTAGDKEVRCWTVRSGAMGT